MSVASDSIIGEKQARTLEPLLATPITTFELLAAKILGALLPAAVMIVVTLVAVLRRDRAPGPRRACCRRC